MCMSPDTKQQHTENTQKNEKSTSHWSLITCFFLDLNDVLYTTILLSICGDYNVKPEQYYKTIFLSHTYLHSPVHFKTTRCVGQTCLNPVLLLQNVFFPP